MGPHGGGRAAEVVERPGAAFGLLVLPWRSANQPHADTFKCQRGAAGTRLSSNTLAAFGCTFHHHGRSQLCLKPITGIKKINPRWFPSINKGANVTQHKV